VVRGKTWKGGWGVKSEVPGGGSYTIAGRGNRRVLGGGEVRHKLRGGAGWRKRKKEKRTAQKKSGGHRGGARSRGGVVDGAIRKRWSSGIGGVQK